MKKLAKYLFPAVLLSTNMSIALPHNETSNAPKRKDSRLLGNAIDALAFSIIAKVVNDFFLENASLSLVESVAYGLSSWLCGEGIEMIYKKAYKVCTKTKLCETLGQTKIAGIEIDNQRLLRRVITLIPTYLGLYLFGSTPTTPESII